jgi:hypothetical protein
MTLWCYLKKQSQFAGVLNGRNISNNNDLWKFSQAGPAKKQSQSKPISSTPEGVEERLEV